MHFTSSGCMLFLLVIVIWLIYLLKNAQDDIQLLVHALDEVGDCIAERLSEKLAMSEEISRLREQIVRHVSPTHL